MLDVIQCRRGIEGLLFLLQIAPCVPSQPFSSQTPQHHTSQNMASPILLTEELWYQERLTTYINITRSIRRLHTTLQEVETAIKARKTQNDSIDTRAMPADIFKYNAGHVPDQMDLDESTDVEDAEELFEESKQQAKEVYGFLWREGHKAELEELRDGMELQEARELVWQIVEKDLVAWEKRVGDVASVGRMLVA